MKRILIIEDEVPIQHALRDSLVRAGFDVLLAKDGQEGLNIALSEIPHLILLDLNMPVMDGLTMLKRLRENEQGKHFMVIILSNEGESVAEAAKLGAIDFLVKSSWKMDDAVKLIIDRLGEAHSK